jgi:type III secretion system FlhB-like substrate exporter
MAIPVTEPIIFIDANQYLDLYGIKNKREKLLSSLVEQSNNIFITSQIVDEVERNKVAVLFNFIKDKLEKFDLKASLPDYLFETSAEITKEIKESTKSLGGDTLKKLINEALADTLEKVSSSHDAVSVALQPIFSRAQKHNDKHLARARDRKEMGNPPGKSSDPLGDQITWEQLLDTCQNVNDLWILTRDSDYCTVAGSRSYLNALLYKDLKRVNKNLNVRCFNTLADGFKNFANFMSTRGKTPKTRLSEEESDSLSQQQISLPTREQLEKISEIGRLLLRTAGVAQAGTAITDVSGGSILDFKKPTQ